jgi:hypothetical protein
MSDFYLQIYKPQKIRVNLSNSFIARARCKACGKSPDIYLSVPLIPQNPRYYDPRISDWVFNLYKKYIKRFINTDWYKKYQPRYFNKLKDFSYYWISKSSYKPTLHQYIGKEHPDAMIVEYLECPCGQTVWAFVEKSAEFRLELKHRRARYSYPQKFELF